VSKKHTFLATSSTDNTLRIWTVSSPSLLYSFNLSSPACSISLPEYFDSQEDKDTEESEGPIVLLSTLSGSLSTIEFSKNLHRTLLSSTPKTSISHIGYIASKRLLISLTSNLMKVYQFGTHLDLKQIYEFEILDTKTCALGAFKMTEEVVVGDVEGAVRVFDLGKMELVKETRA
jgi:WD40 repeat protein